jgi:hypothetical protein
MTSNTVPAVTSFICIQLGVGTVHAKLISLQLNVHVLIVSENVTRKTPVKEVLGVDCPIAKSIVAIGLLISIKWLHKYENVLLG